VIHTVGCGVIAHVNDVRLVDLQSNYASHLSDLGGGESQAIGRTTPVKGRPTRSSRCSPMACNETGLAGVTGNVPMG
jgi:hypothetical protein